LDLPHIISTQESFEINMKGLRPEGFVQRLGFAKNPSICCHVKGQWKFFLPIGQFSQDYFQHLQIVMIEFAETCYQHILHVCEQVMVPGFRFQQLEFPSGTILER
jgi:hypothetical protein